VQCRVVCATQIPFATILLTSESVMAVDLVAGGAVVTITSSSPKFSLATSQQFTKLIFCCCGRLIF